MGFFDNYGQGVNAGIQNLIRMRESKRDRELEDKKFTRQEALDAENKRRWEEERKTRMEEARMRQEMFLMQKQQMEQAQADKLYGREQQRGMMNAATDLYSPQRAGAWDQPNAGPDMQSMDMRGDRNIDAPPPSFGRTMAAMGPYMKSNDIGEIIKTQLNLTKGEKEKDLAFEEEDQFDPTTGFTSKRRVGRDKLTGEVKYKGDWRTTGERKADKPKSRQLKGFDKKTNRPVYNDPNTDAPVYDDGSPYRGGQLAPITEPGTVTVLQQATKPDDMELLADAIEQGKNTLANVAKGMGGAHTAREVSKVLQRRGVDVTTIDLNIKAKGQALGALEKTVNQLKPFEETAKKNLDYANKLSKEYVRSKYPALNKLIVAWDENTGDPLVEKFKVATYDGMAEAMKHMMAGSGITAAELSIGAQEQAKKLLSTTKNWQQFDAVFEAIKVGLKNRSKAYRERLLYLRNQPVTKFDPEELEAEFEEKMNVRAGDFMGRITKGEDDNIPQAAKDELRRTPHTAALFDLTFGKGSSRRVLGGK